MATNNFVCSRCKSTCSLFILIKSSDTIFNACTVTFAGQALNQSCFGESNYVELTMCAYCGHTMDILCDIYNNADSQSSDHENFNNTVHSSTDTSCSRTSTSTLASTPERISNNSNDSYSKLPTTHKIAVSPKKTNSIFHKFSGSIFRKILHPIFFASVFII